MAIYFILEKIHSFNYILWVIKEAFSSQKIFGGEFYFILFFGNCSHRVFDLLFFPLHIWSHSMRLLFYYFIRAFKANVFGSLKCFLILWLFKHFRDNSRNRLIRNFDGNSEILAFHQTNILNQLYKIFLALFRLFDLFIYIG